MDMLLKIYEEDRYEKKIIIIISVTISIIVLLLCVYILFIKRLLNIYQK